MKWTDFDRRGRRRIESGRWTVINAVNRPEYRIPPSLLYTRIIYRRHYWHLLRCVLSSIFLQLTATVFCFNKYNQSNIFACFSLAGDVRMSTTRAPFPLQAGGGDRILRDADEIWILREYRCTTYNRQSTHTIMVGVPYTTSFLQTLETCSVFFRWSEHQIRKIKVYSPLKAGTASLGK
jgi:hypothetical protein